MLTVAVLFILATYCSFNVLAISRKKSIEELRGESLNKLYQGQDREPGSFEANNILRQKLTDSGIDINEPILIIHTAKPCSDDSLDKKEILVARLKDNDFELQGENETTGDLRFTKIANIKPITFNKFTSELNDFLYEFGWQYEGWSVTQSESQ